LFNSSNQVSPLFSASDSGMLQSQKQLPESILLLTLSTDSIYSFARNPSDTPPCHIVRFTEGIQLNATSSAPSIEEDLWVHRSESGYRGCHSQLKTDSDARRSINSFNSFREAVLPVGMCGKLTHINFTLDRSLFQERLDVNAPV
jgi:hypothetical protein